MRFFFSGWLLLTLWILGIPDDAFAAPWRRIEPGKTPGRELFARFGKPTKKVRRGGKTSLVFSGRQAPGGTKKVEFLIDAKGIVERVEVVPQHPVEPWDIEVELGPACQEPTRTTDCYVESTEGTASTWRYTSGILVFFNKRKTAVQSLVFRPRPPDKAELARSPESPETPTPPVASKPPDVQLNPDEEPYPEEPGADAPGAPTTAPPFEASERDNEVFGEDANAADEAAPVPASQADPLKVGGNLYLLTFLDLPRGSRLSDATVSSPALVDIYLDGTPHDRVRVLTVGQLTYDPLDAANTTTPDVITGSPRAASAVPRLELDQLWLRFDVARTIFVTMGRQHVKWGVAQFWFPTDFLMPSRRNPFTRSDDRLGTNVIKLHVPWERLGWNFYGFLLWDIPTPATKLGKVGSALRAELLLGPAEVGLGAVVDGDGRFKGAVDISSGVGPFDVYAEVALQKSSNLTQWRRVSGTSADAAFAEQFERLSPKNAVAVQTAAGVLFERELLTESVLTLNLEYFFNSPGYTSTEVYPWLLSTGDFVPLYVGRHYLGASASLGVGPSQFLSFGTSGVVNLSDKSWTIRADITELFFEQLSASLFVAVSGGPLGGEFQLHYDVPTTDGSGSMVAFRPSVLNAGLSFFVKF